MNQNFDYVFNYLDREEILFNKTEFLFQIQSHPDYPSLLSVVDTLNFLNIPNGAFSVDTNEINLLPHKFIALLRVKDSIPKLFFVEKKGNFYTYIVDKKIESISISGLESIWTNTVLLAEKSEFEIEKTYKNKANLVLSFLTIVFVFAVLFQFEKNLLSTIFLLFPVLGLIFSILALKDLFGVKIEFINKLCNISISTSCTTVVNSNKWKFFEILNFSDLSIVFFSFQIVAFFASAMSGTLNAFLSIQTILLFCSVPVIILSLYYQKFVEKKWCPTCLMIIGIILIELSFLMIIVKFANNELSLNTILLLSFTFITTSLIWHNLKKLLLKNKELKEFQLKSNRFQRNYELFKNSLIASTKIDLTETQIILGNKESKIEITIITNPFCGFCEAAHNSLEKILKKYQNQIQIKIIFRVDINNENEKGKLLFTNLLRSYIEEGEIIFRNSLNNWFKIKNIDNWIKLNVLSTETNKYDNVFIKDYNWCSINNFNFTPAIFVNGYRYPSAYDVENLEYFINDLIEDINL